MIVAVVLAAGGSRRLGRPKQLLHHRGVPLVRFVVDVLVAAPSVARVGVVTGAHGAAVAAVLPSDVEAIPNRGWSTGIAGSVRAAARWAAPASALLLALVDQPRLSVDHVEALIAAWRAGHPAAASTYGDVVGVPAILDRSLFARLATLEGDRGAARALRDVPRLAHVPWEDGAIDVDYEADVARLEPSAEVRP